MSDKPKIIGIHNRGPGNLWVSFPHTAIRVTKLRADETLTELPDVRDLNLNDAVVWAESGQTCNVEYTTAED